MQSIDDVPDQFPVDAKETDKLDWLRRMALLIVERVWVQPSDDDINDIVIGFKNESESTEGDSTFCFCNEGMVNLILLYILFQLVFDTI